MDTQKYLSYFFPFEKPDFFKNGKDSLWNINGDRTMIALAMTFRKEPEAQVMCFMRNYAERYDWLEQTFQDWSFTFLSSFLFYEEDEEMDEDRVNHDIHLLMCSVDLSGRFGDMKKGVAFRDTLSREAY